MRAAFTLLEIIFVIVLIGIMAGVGSSMFKTNYLLHDVNSIVLKIREAQYRGIGFEHYDMTAGTYTIAPAVGCITLSKAALADDNYKLHVDNFDYGTLCFDAKGEPHNGNFTTPPMVARKVLTFTHHGVEQQITVEPVSGYAIIKP